MKIFKAASVLSVMLLLLGLGFSQSSYAQSQRIQKGDILEIAVYGHQELSKTIKVQSDGTVNYPLVSNIPIDGLYLDEFRDVLTAQVSKYLGERPIITVRFSESLNVSVVVLGQVAVPGEYLVSKNATVQGAITQAGGFTPRAQIEEVKLFREIDDKTDITYVNLYNFFIKGNPELLPGLEEGDIIVVPGIPGTHDVKVIGEVEQPGSYTVFQGANLVDALYLAGGPTDMASLKKIRIVSPLSRVSKDSYFDLEKCLHADINNFKDIPEINPGDIIYIPKRSGFWRGLFNFTKGFTSLVAPIVMIIYYLNR